VLARDLRTHRPPLRGIAMGRDAADDTENGRHASCPPGRLRQADGSTMSSDAVLPLRTRTEAVDEAILSAYLPHQHASRARALAPLLGEAHLSKKRGVAGGRR